MRVAKGTALMVGNIVTLLLQKTHKTPINVVQAQTARSCLRRRLSVRMCTASESAFAQNNVFHRALVAKSAMLRRDVYPPDPASPHWIATLVKNARLTLLVVQGLVSRLWSLLLLSFSGLLSSVRSKEYNLLELPPTAAPAPELKDCSLEDVKDLSGFFGGSPGLC